MPVTPAPNLRIVSLTGAARAGKSTVAQFLSLYGGFKVIHLADGIRSALDDLDGPTWEQRKERGAIGMTERTAMQVMGTEARDRLAGIVFGPQHHWCNHAMIKMFYCMELHPAPCSRFVVPDMRHQFEHEYFWRIADLLGGSYECWRITRPDVGEIAESGHSSEAEWSAIVPARRIANDGSMHDLYTASLACMGCFLRGEKVAS
jgi:hypothetical protein